MYRDNGFLNKGENRKGGVGYLNGMVLIREKNGVLKVIN